MKQRRVIGPLVVVASLLAACSPELPPASALPTGSVEALIKRQSQEFSDAAASGDAAALSRLLDDRVTFINESGDTATKKDIVGSAGPLPNGIRNHLVQTDFHVQLYGTVAVTSFTDVQT